jgi:membrane-associated phospholipid phosphatase
MRIRLFSLVVLFASCQILNAQTDSSALSTTVKEDALTALKGAEHVFTSPLHWQCRDFGAASGALWITGGSAFLDTYIRDAVKQDGDAHAKLADAARLYGEGWFVVGVTLGGYGTGLLIKDRWLRETALLAGTAILVSTVVTQVLKPIVGRGRPYLNSGNGTFHPLTLTNNDYHSFPSGHTVAAFSLSSVLAARIDHPLATIGLYGLATLTALSRVYTDQHWFSDVVFGGIFASAIGRSLVAWHDERSPGQHAIRILPGADGLTIVYGF